MKVIQSTYINCTPAELRKNVESMKVIDRASEDYRMITMYRR